LYIKEYFYVLGAEKLGTKQERINTFKNAMANYPTGVSVVTTTDENDKPVGLTVNSFASVSVDPLLVLWSIDRRVSTYEPFSNTNKFAVNILREDQADLAYTFSSSDDDDRFTNCSWNFSENGLPIIDNVITTLQCTLYKQVEAGDHLTLIGEVIDIQTNEENPLLYHGRKLAPLPANFHQPSSS